MTAPDSHNILKFPQKRQEKQPVPPMLNIPPATKYLSGFVLGLYALIWLSGFVLKSDPMPVIAVIGGFTSGSWTGAAPFWWWTPLTPLSSILLHGSWMHAGVNTLMLVAVGSSIEKTLGAKYFLMIFFLSSWIALVTHLAFSPFSVMPVVGASGGISGLFGAILWVMRDRNSNFKATILIWIGISALFGLMGAPDGSPIAWIAHIGGFVGGIGLAMLITKRLMQR